MVNRHTEISIGYRNTRTNKYYKIEDRVEEVSITECAVGEGDTIDITLFDKDKMMLYNNWPGIDDTLDCTMFLKEEGTTKVIGNETFHVDQIAYTDYPSKFTLRGISVPKNSTFSKTPQTKTWQNISMSNIVWNICAKYGLSHYYENGSVNPHIKKLEQSNATDLSFLYNLCQTYGNGMKIYANKLVVFSEEVYEKKSAVRTITRNDIIDGTFSARFDLIRQYTGCEYEYDVGDTHWTKSLYFVVKPEIKISVGQCDSEAEGLIKGKAKVNGANRDLQIITFQILGDPRMVSTATFNLSGFGGLDGKYYINKTVNTFSSSGGFTQEIEARRIQQRL